MGTMGAGQHAGKLGFVGHGHVLLLLMLAQGIATHRPHCASRLVPRNLTGRDGGGGGGLVFAGNDWF